MMDYKFSGDFNVSDNVYHISVVLNLYIILIERKI